MPRPIVPSRLHGWLRVTVLVVLGASVAACSDSARVNNFNFNTRTSQAAPPPRDVTGSIAPRPAPSGYVSSQPLPAPSRPATVAASGVSSGAEGLGAYRPPVPSAEITGSVTQRVAAAPPAPPAPPPPAGHWTWDGGSPVTVGRGENVETIARRYGVPASAILQTNGIARASAVRPGQRLVIPRYVTGHAAPATAPRVAAAPPARHVAAAATTYVIQPGDTLIGIARKHRIKQAELARANRLELYAKLQVGERLAIPGSAHSAAASRQPAVPAPRQVAMRQPPPVQHVQPRPAPHVEKVATVPVQNARMVTPVADTPTPAAKTAEPAGAMPSFRWPVKGRIILGFGARPNGTHNDGINLAVPAGTPIRAAEDGVVAYAGNELKGYGNLVLLRHANGFVSAYANASELMVKRGDAVKRGQVIAHAGQTGNVNSPQLHFEIRRGSTPVDPTKYLSGV
jgi:murein DD-endopeptidase MepM/ murein hydrolase activator NlpD